MSIIEKKMKMVAKGTNKKKLNNTIKQLIINYHTSKNEK